MTQKIELTSNQRKYFQLIYKWGYDRATSRRQLQQHTQEDKVVVENILKQLKELGLIRLTDKWVVNLSAAGKKYAKDEQIIHITPVTEQGLVSIPGPVSLAVPNKAARITPAEKGKKEREHVAKEKADPVLSSITQLESKLKGQHIQVNKFDLKCQVLGRLANILDPEISDVLTDIQADLTTVAGLSHD